MKNKPHSTTPKSPLEDLGVNFIFDGTFEGLLCCVFDAYVRKEFPLQVYDYEKPLLFAEVHRVVTDNENSERILQGLHKRLSKYAVEMLFTCYLAEQEEVNNSLFRYICKAFRSEQSIEMNFADEDVLFLSKIYKKVKHEAERMRQFVRFQKTADGMYFAYIEPLYNVLPCVSDFFEDRFADQQWIIYDAKRKYALYYDLQKTETISFDSLNVNPDTGELADELKAADQNDFEQMWREYLQSVTIRQRINPKLQRQFMPKRFWKYLTEKKHK